MNSSNLTASQESIWVSHKLDSNSITNYLPHLFHLYHRIDEKRFKNSFSLLIKNNDALRTIIRETESGNAEQIVLKNIEFDIPTRTLNGSEELDSYIEERVQTKLDLSVKPFDSVLFELGSEHYVWYLNIHHILADASSFKTLFDEMAQLYENEETTLSETQSFEEYRQLESSKRSDVDSTGYKYWKAKSREHHKDIFPYGNKGMPGSKGSERIKISLDKSVKELIDHKIDDERFRSLNKDLSRFTLWSTLYASFLHRILGESNIRIGSPFPNRNQPKTKKTAGLLIEVLPFEVNIDDDDSFETIFLKVRTELYSFFRNGYPGAQDASKSHGIHFIINYIPFHFGDFGKISSKTEWLFTDLDQSHQLRLQIFDFNDPENMDYFLDVNTQYFTDEQLKTIVDQFKNFIVSCLRSDTSPLNSIALVEKGEDSPYLSSSIFGTALKGDLKLDSLNQVFENNSSSIAIIDNERSYSFQELNGLVEYTANHISTLGLGPGSRIAIMKPRSTEFIVWALASIKVGAAFVPIPGEIPQKRSRYILEDVSPDLVISDNKADLAFNVTDIDLSSIKTEPVEKSPLNIRTENTAYILYTSGSSGKPKGVAVSVRSLLNYITNGVRLYTNEEPVSMPLFTSLGFDLTITSIFLPLVTGGRVVIYPETKGPDLSILEVIKDDRISGIKLTPSHAQLIRNKPLSRSLKYLIFGGEELETMLARDISENLPIDAKIHNEYGPTEATVGCVVKTFDPDENSGHSVPIGKPIAGCEVYILDHDLNPVPQGVVGNLFLGGDVLAKGYWNNTKLTREAFIDNPYKSEAKIYNTGDRVRLSATGDLEYLGRSDNQLKLNGVRIEATELQGLMKEIEGVEEAYVCVTDTDFDHYEPPASYCTRCGLPSNYPGVSFNDEGLCSLCDSFDEYQKNVSSYFKSMDNLQTEILALGEGRDNRYDCMMLLSGGKDSSYALAKLVELGLNVLAFTLDNGFISDGAKANINNTTKQLKVDHIYGTTEAMNAIFRDSLERYQNVCNGCFKTLYTLSTKVALEKNIPVIVTGLSRGQFFETRLTEELFNKENFDPSDIDNIILEARKTYHRSKDAVSEHLDVSIFEDDAIFEKISFVDFYRFSDVSLSEMLNYLDTHVGWKRPEDTGRSTNCIINDLGIYVHKRKLGYHNYAFPYSWDVRVGHKKREETIDELNDELSEDEIRGLIHDIGLEDIDSQKEIRAYYKAKRPIGQPTLVEYLQKYLPTSMIPSVFLQVDSFPLTSNGKIDEQALIKQKSVVEVALNKVVEEPENKIEQLILDIWKDVLKREPLGVTDSFISVGGNSLSAIRIVSQLGKRLNLEIGIQTFFEQNTVRLLAKYIEEEIRRRISSQ